jgi:hypothetical protein
MSSYIGQPFKHLRISGVAVVRIIGFPYFLNALKALIMLSVC